MVRILIKASALLSLCLFALAFGSVAWASPGAFKDAIESCITGQEELSVMRELGVPEGFVRSSQDPESQAPGRLSYSYSGEDVVIGVVFSGHPDGEGGHLPIGSPEPDSVIRSRLVLGREAIPDALGNASCRVSTSTREPQLLALLADALIEDRKPDADMSIVRHPDDSKALLVFWKDGGDEAALRRLLLRLEVKEAQEAGIFSVKATVSTPLTAFNPDF